MAQMLNQKGDTGKLLHINLNANEIHSDDSLFFLLLGIPNWSHLQQVSELAMKELPSRQKN